MGKSLTAEKSFGFAIRIVRLYKILYERKEFVLSKQMLRSGTAIGALLKEAEHAQSKADFISKVNIALKEANETEYWIMLLKETDYLSEKEYESIIEDCRELIKLTVSIVKTSKQNMNGTSKYILTNMAQNGENFDIVLKKAQDLGYAEADPAFDIGGFDAAHKL